MHSARGSSFTDFQLVVGLEVHIQLNCKGKLFSSDKNIFGCEPNTNVSALNIAHPGTLPIVNQKAIDSIVLLGIACKSEINKLCFFDRKSYFYPDSPKGFQITQDNEPFCKGGILNIKVSKNKRDVKLTKMHLEEDAGKSIHDKSSKDTYVDLNRAGTPLIELVTEPEIHSSEEAKAFVQELRRLVQFINISDGNMEEGSMRCDANVSVRRKGSTELGIKVEIKNLNSTRNLQRAIDGEFKRQVEEVLKGNEIISETRDYRADSNTSVSLRTKETLDEYRYFPDPDLPFIQLTEADIKVLKEKLILLPWELETKLLNKFSLSKESVQFLSQDIEIAQFFLKACEMSCNYQKMANWLMGAIQKWLNKEGTSLLSSNLTPKKLAFVVDAIEDKKVSYTTAANELLPKLMTDNQFDITQAFASDNEEDKFDFNRIKKDIHIIFEQYSDKVLQYKKGKKGLLGFFMGQIMKMSGKGKDPKEINILLEEELKNL